VFLKNITIQSNTHYFPFLIFLTLCMHTIHIHYISHNKSYILIPHVPAILLHLKHIIFPYLPKTHHDHATLSHSDIINRDGNGAGRTPVSLSHTHPRKKNSSTSPYPNPTGIKLLSLPHPPIG